MVSVFEENGWGSGRRYSDALPDGEPTAPGEGAATHVIGVLPGEGVGPEVVQVALEVLEAVGKGQPWRLDLRIGGDIGLPAQRACGKSLSDEVVGFCGEVFADGGALFCGPGGGRFVYDLRTRFDLFCKLTPVRSLPVLDDTGVIKPAARRQVDILAVRENSGGLYFGEWGRQDDSAGGRSAFHRFQYSEAEVERILTVALNLARMRRGRLCLVLKPGGVPAICDLWQETLARMEEGAQVATEVLEVDNAVYQLIAQAGRFDVLVSPNMFGDVLADCASLLLGSRGMSYSGNFGPPGLAVYQTGHGAARDLEGTGRANPVGQVLAVAMMLRESFGLCDSAAAIETAIARTLAAGWRTPDIAGPDSRVVGTRELGRRIVEALGA